MYDDVSQSMVRGMVVSILFPFGLLLTVDLSIMVVVTGQRTLRGHCGAFSLLGPDA